MSNKIHTEHSSAPDTQQVNNGETFEARPIRYVVVREGIRVSDKEYEFPTDTKCIGEVQFWTRVAQNHSHGEKVEVVPYDSRKHRVW